MRVFSVGIAVILLLHTFLLQMTAFPAWFCHGDGHIYHRVPGSDPAFSGVCEAIEEKHEIGRSVPVGSDVRCSRDLLRLQI